MPQTPPPSGQTPLDRHPPGQTPLGRHPWADTLGRHPRADTPWADTPWVDTPKQTCPSGKHPLPSACWDTRPPLRAATAADGTHPTGMYSCKRSVFLVHIRC